MRFIFYSPIAFEPWDWRNSVERGIGGSETSHVEMAWRLAKRGHEVKTYAPIPDDCPGEWRGTTWHRIEEADFAEEAIWVLYRCPDVIDRFIWPWRPSRLWLIMQDWNYAEFWNARRLDRLERIVPLSHAHKSWLLRQEAGRFPEMAEKMWVTSNGLKLDLIEEVEAEEPYPTRNPARVMYASSPDRGLLPLLKSFRKAAEIVPELELHTFYGFDNLDKLIARQGPSSGFAKQKSEILRLAEHPRVTVHGRVSQNQLYREWLQTGIWVYQTNFAETSPVHGDTVVETLEGPRTIKSLVGRQGFHVYSCDPRTARLSISTVWDVRCTRRRASVIRLRYRPGRGRNARREQTLVLTPDHEVMLRNGTYIPAGHLRPGDRIKAFHRRANGWSSGYDTIGLTGESPRPAHRFVAEWVAGAALDAVEVVDHLNGLTQDNRPSNLLVHPSQSRHAADHWQRDHRRMARAVGEGTRRHLRSLPQDQVREMKSRARRVMWDRIDALSPQARDEWLRWRRSRRALPNHVIVSVEQAEASDVYCMEVDPDHNFVANGIVVHNCITAMEAQALGAIPIVNPIWALGENVHHGLFIQGDAVHDPLVAARFAHHLALLARDPVRQTLIRAVMMPDARARFSWERFVSQWEDAADDPRHGLPADPRPCPCADGHRCYRHGGPA